MITQRTPQALRGDALRAVLEPLGFDDEFAGAARDADVIALPVPFPDVELGPPPSSDEPRALTGDELSRVLEALRTTT